ncbi:MAG: hypothetical protein AABX05_05130 [Nanoarchaeota archaeon]
MLREMLLNVKLWGIIAGITFGLIILTGILGNVLGSRWKDVAVFKQFMLGSMIFLAFVLVFSFTPFAINLILSFQAANAGQSAIVNFLLNNRVTIIVCVWALEILGLLVALILAPWKTMLSP